MYELTSESGDSVRAEVNPTWINVYVGLGHWPSAVQGLIANAKGNVNQIETRDHFVLTKAFNFEDLYHRFADSWRVPAEASMLSACGREVERAAPAKAFYAKDLEPAVREKAQGVCATAGVKAGPLLEACTLDVAVIGQDAAAKAFVAASPPVAVGTIAGSTSGGGAHPNRWWLLLVLLALIVIVWFFMRKAT